MNPFEICTVWRCWLEGKRPWVQRLLNFLVSKGLVTGEDYNVILFGTREDLTEFGRQIISSAQHSPYYASNFIESPGAYPFIVVVTPSRDEALHADRHEMTTGARADVWRSWRYRYGDKRPNGRDKA